MVKPYRNLTRATVEEKKPTPLPKVWEEADLSSFGGGEKRTVKSDLIRVKL